MFETAQRCVDTNDSIEPGALRDAGLRMALALDAGLAEQVWRAASAVVQELVSCADFTQAIVERRRVTGKVRRRDWKQVSRQVSTGSANDALPQGIYACAEFTVTCDDGRTGREVVSFRLDDDGVWRFVGDHIESRDWLMTA